MIPAAKTMNGKVDQLYETMGDTNWEGIESRLLQYKQNKKKKLVPTTLSLIYLG
jgi:hypothetical protein